MYMNRCMIFLSHAFRDLLPPRIPAQALTSGADLSAVPNLASAC